MTDPREEKLPAWARQLIAELRRRVQFGNEPLVAEIAKLRPHAKLMQNRNEAMTLLLDCAAKGGHVTASEIMDVIRDCDLILAKKESK